MMVWESVFVDRRSAAPRSIYGRCCISREMGVSKAICSINGGAGKLVVRMRVLGVA